ncbi:NADH dehydrogenase [ubiquinone] 1 alpha subcomplex subunit 13 [Sitodiplosis mosellana]|uniref:NADH dehydrogenase [ubiquinone] 1 alpha subcomplex subunit 13 n=1 Tax=Sitodiplosis mosellana TaxID=263140 RepID=UPI0024440D66|nr:NADH dehydrogenase [ubiquinone] 1 alpha subcomplex subunit 13 [Sitodiplosis mosellana]
MATPPVQDLPPPGGYNPINFKRVQLKPILSAKLMFAGYAALTAGAYYMYYLTDQKITREEIEMRSCRNVMLPIVFAERDREYLKQIRRNRDEEARLMANVEGWKVGTWFGEPVYKTVKSDDWIDPSIQEFYCHTAHKHFLDLALFKHYT